MNTLRRFVWAGWLMLAVSGASAQASLTIPDCGAMRAWAADLPLLQGRGGSESPQDRETRARILSDARVAQVFGRPPSQWNSTDREAVRAAVGACESSLRQGGAVQDAVRVSAAGMHLYRQAQSRGTRASADRRLRTPDCVTVGRWIDAGWSAPDGTSLERRQAQMFTDGATQPLFGIAFSSWDANDMTHAGEHIGRCYGELFPRGGGGTGATGPHTAQAMQAARSYLKQRIRQAPRP
jgi:hypothetical protein